MYFLPLYYLFHSRFKSRNEKLSWLIIYLLPQVFFVSSISRPGFLFDDLLILFLCICSLFSVYECGYLENDTLTIKKEINPTLRISVSEILYVQNNINAIVIFKLMLAFLLLGFASFISEGNHAVLEFAFCLLAVFLVFKLHNYSRSRLNVLTFHLLSVLKYLSPLVVFYPFSSGEHIYSVCYFFFPVIRTIEHARKEKYRFDFVRKFVTNPDGFRVAYYFVFTLALLMLCLNDQVSIILLVMSCIMFFYRVTLYIFLRNGTISRS